MPSIDLPQDRATYDLWTGGDANASLYLMPASNRKQLNIRSEEA